ncbi:MAG: hypothetical protein A2927_00995 [Candidatus Komeilibacteria bacterium RIFCSPLOWO2_01_FULL_45_10]|uniref:Cytochrome C biogenesis protein transmembrane domain-containing protein n=1 Tax=Candidatus Komeilibacteria bacterium RIFCSPLOWO2_01_FULL_45_10 TaxID=1798550 RepID=A0A1G2BNN3_9BACT|nr:MAG: hypothetical protein A2927_00995 [Candidatus Komeilibacteria bacterium RIFCSPLOWO2_01_FULL_45_10]
MDVIFSASLIAAFAAGLVALFAPCCITVLLPAYLASAFRQKAQILKMTFVFFAGIAVILIPIGLGAAAIAQLFRDFHREMYFVGGSLMLILAVLAILGKGLALMPMTKRIKTDMRNMDVKSVFLLGIFSGAATSCCAPVLAGAVTLAAISGVFWKALLVTFAYVFGMTFPLFILAYFYDRFKLQQSKFIQGKLWEVKIGGKTIFVHSTNLLAGLIFLLMSVILLYLALTHNAFYAPVWQTKLGEGLNQWSQKVVPFLNQIPDGIWAALILSLFGYWLYWSKKNSTKS